MGRLQEGDDRGDNRGSDAEPDNQLQTRKPEPLAHNAAITKAAVVHQEGGKQCTSFRSLLLMLILFSSVSHAVIMLTIV